MKALNHEDKELLRKIITFINSGYESRGITKSVYSDAMRACEVINKGIELTEEQIDAVKKTLVRYISYLDFVPSIKDVSSYEIESCRAQKDKVFVLISKFN